MTSNDHPPPQPTRALTRENIAAAHALIERHIHRTPVLTCTTLDTLASTPQTPSALASTPWSDQVLARPRMRLFFKAENQQKIGAFKARGAFHAVTRLIQSEGLPNLRERGVVTHSSGNHAQALALAARTFGIPARIVMPRISTPSKIAGTRAQGAELHFSGSTEPERVAVVEEVQARTGATLVPPYDHADIMLGQGTAAFEFEGQVKEMTAGEAGGVGSEGLDAVVAPTGGGGLLSGTATALAGSGVMVFGAEPMFEGADDCARGLAEDPPRRIEKVSTLTICDGLRTPIGRLPWTVISDREKVAGVYAVTEEQVKSAMRLIMERMKVVVEPSGAVGLAVALYHEGFRKLVEREMGEDGVWNVGIILSGGNTTMEAIAKLFAEDASEIKKEREGAKVGMNGERVAENVAG